MTDQEPEVEILTARPRREVIAGDGFVQVLQHTDWYVHEGDRYAASQYGHPYYPHYRYHRYSEVLDILGTASPDRKLAHVDIGCGAGIFSWVLLDWATEKGIEYDRIGLYGLDHSPAMINLAHAVKDKLAERVAGYPNLHYYYDSTELLSELVHNHSENTSYIVSFGHTLVQAISADRENIINFTRIVENIIWLMNVKCKCWLIAVDARGQADIFRNAWELLLNTLPRTDISYQLRPVLQTRINSPADAILVRLSPI